MAVIRYKVAIKSRLEKLLCSEYSKMFEECEYNSLLLRNDSLVKLYTSYSVVRKKDEIVDKD